MKDYYKTLGVGRDATEEDIKKAFRRLALQHHPDRNEGDKASEEKFKEINEAYSCLSNPEKRANYDRFGSAEGPGGFGGGFGGGFAGANFGDIFEDIFGDFFGGGRSAHRPAKGDDLRYDMSLNLKEAAFGAEKVIDVRRLDECAECSGSGSKSGKKTVCSNCKGAGQVRYQQGFFSISKTCGKCGGHGAVVTDPCKACSGRGRVSRTAKLSVKIPPGVDTGARLRMSGEGDPGTLGGPRGDLYIFLNVEPHEFFKRDGAELYCEVPISFSQAALGTEVEVPTLDGAHKLKIPPGTQPGTDFRIRGKGIPSLGGRSKGDQIVTVNVSVPKNLSDRQRELIEELAGLGDEEAPKTFTEKLKNIFTG